MQSHVIYKQAKECVFARDTGYIESANNSTLIYLDKIIHYGNRTYKTQQNLWILDWNEHVNRPHTSLYKEQKVDNESQNYGHNRCQHSTMAPQRTIIFFMFLSSPYICMPCDTSDISQYRAGLNTVTEQMPISLPHVFHIILRCLII